MVGAARNRFSDWLWSTYGDRAAARSISARCGSSHAVRNSSRVSAGSASMPCTEPSARLIGGADLVRPQPTRLQLGDEGVVDLEELAGQGLALEQVGHLRLDALVAAGDRGDGGGRRDRDQQRVAQPVPVDRARSAAHRSVCVGTTSHRSGWSRPAAARGLGVRRVRSVRLRQAGGGLQRGQVDLLGDPGRQLARRGGVERQPQGEEDVLQAHHAEPDRPPARVRRRRLRGRVVVDVDHAVEEGDRGADGRAQPLPVDAVAA